ncbi:MAG: alginate lyase family protein [Balneolales bacterium]
MHLKFIHKITPLIVGTLLIISVIGCGTSQKTSLWLSQEEINQFPTEGESFENVVRVANLGQEADISDQNNDHNNQTYAQALLCARGVDDNFCVQAKKGLQDVIGTEENGRTLALGRNLLAYVLAADVINYKEEEFMNWLDEVRHNNLEGRTLISTHEDRPNNWGTHAGASRIAASYYVGDEDDLERAAKVFHGWLGNRDAYSDFSYGGLDWQADPEAPVGINPPGSIRDGHSIDGVLPDDMRRCADGSFQWPPCKTGYNWEALQGVVMQAEMLTRLGYSAWEWESKAILRTVNWLYETTFDNGSNEPAVGDDRWQPWLINFAYDTDFPTERGTQPGKNIGLTDWTHDRERP